VLSNIRFDENFNKDEDFDFFLRLSLNTKFLFVPDAQVIRRVQINSLSRHESKRKVSLNKAKILNNFYYNLGGDKTVPKSLAMREISRIYRKTAFRYYEDGKPNAAIPIFKKAVSYNKFESKNYYGLLKALISSKTYNKL